MAKRLPLFLSNSRKVEYHTMVTTRKATHYVELPEELANGKRKDVSVTVTIHVNVPKEMENVKTDKFIRRAMDKVGEMFDDFVEKRCDMLLQNGGKST